MKAALRQNMTPANVKDDLVAFGTASLTWFSFHRLLCFCLHPVFGDLANDSIPRLPDVGIVGIADEKAAAVGAKWRTGLADLSRSAAGQTLNVNELVDMDWRFGGT